MNFIFFRQAKDSLMSGSNSNPETGQTQTNTNETGGHAEPGTPTATQPQSFVRPPPSQSFDPAPEFMEAYDCAKLNNNWNKVSSSLMIHPEWLTRIPEGLF